MNRVFITGASSGIGEALAREYALQGATLGLLARRGDALRRLAASLPNAGLHKVYAVDVTDRAALAAAAADFIAAGGADIVIANAGVSQGTLTEHAEDLVAFDAIFATNVSATVATFAPFIAAMKTRGGSPTLVGIGSVAGIRGLPGAGAYSASKAAVLAYCESLRLEMKPYGIRVVTIAPGYIDTPMTRHNPYPMPFLMPAATFAEKATIAIAVGASYRVIPWQMGVVAKLLRALPNAVYDLAFSRAPRKPRASKP
ncbi:short-chain dehydrogenase [Massilia eurypsychrophila]|jgi:short-subunit dehydrogenase|uniref:Short-chain dehydrogenase n=1 Tax=Massilia eurypsychrophila TaxID=1485217 RepID=A0A2G8THE3_9BURK|nr:SDR family oxidoreductase [Massilia eurypsychrophila]PIL45477.1 short-chain dehydrogenase [Massilia eurypsychrophila]